MKKQIQDQVTAPEFELVDTRGQTIRLADYRGRPVVLVLMRGFA